MGCFTHEELQKMYEYMFDKKMKEIHPTILHTKYIKSSIKVSCKCNICNYEWQTTPDVLLRKDVSSGCPKCANNVRATDEELRNKLKNKFEDIIILSEDIRERKSIIYKFKDSDILYTNTPSTMLKKNFTSFKRYWNNDIYKEELKKINPNIECISDFEMMNKKILHYCKIHKKEFLIDPCHALRGQGCDECKLMKIGNAKRKPLNDYLTELKLANENLELIGEYISLNIPTKHKCLKCNHEWFPYPLNLLHGEGCPKCASSIGEKTIADILKKYNVHNIPQYRFKDCKSKHPLPFDFAIFDNDSNLKFLIEYQGAQHYVPARFGNIPLSVAEENLKNCQMRDKIKSDYCNSKNIDLLVIPYTDIKELHNIIYNKLCDNNLIFQ